MNTRQSTKISKNSLPFLSLKFGAVALMAGLFITVFTNNHRQYSAGGIIVKEDKDKDNDARGMMEFFFNARKNNKTNKMDYQSMIAASIADRAMSKASRMHSISASLPQFTWDSYGPTATGGRTRAILIDKNDPTHQTIFAGGVTGGIWKSTDGGSHWGSLINTVAFSQDDQMANMNICCISQDADGNIYVGTGEGFTEAGGGEEFSQGEVGGGIFKSTDDGVTWNVLPSTIPTANTLNGWAFTNRIATQPNSPNTVYAATNYGLYISRDGGTSWRPAWSTTGQKLAGVAGDNSMDVKVSGDGSVIVACIKGYGYICQPLGGNDSTFLQIHATGAGRLPGGAERIEFAISPTNPNRIYASDIQGPPPYGVFGTANLGSGIFMTTTALTNGGYWYDIGPGGSLAFDPYYNGSFDQCGYDNTLAVFPNNEGYLLLGGTTYWKWNETKTGDTVGTWAKISRYNAYYNGDPLWAHPDEHAIVFDPSDPNIVFFGSDGGIFKSIDATNAENINGAMTFQPYNRNYGVTQFYHIAYSSHVKYDSAVPYGNTTKIEGLGLGGGTQDNGSPYIDGQEYYPNDGTDMSGGDGGAAAVSQISPNIAYFCIDYGTFLGRTGNLSNLVAPTNAYTRVIGPCLGGNIDSIAGLSQGCFVFPVALYENPFDLLNHDSVQYTANKNYSIGDTIYPQSDNGPLYYPIILTKAVAKGATITVPDRVVSRLAVAFTGNQGIWINGQGASNSNVVWKPIGGAGSKPSSYASNSPIHALAWSPDGNALFSGDESGVIYRFSNLNACDSKDYCSGAVWYVKRGGGRIAEPGDTLVISTKLNSPLAGRDILSIAIDPKQGNNMLVTAGNFGNSDYVYYSANALSATPSFTSVQGDLPHMPVYSCILDIDSSGTFYSGSAMVGTEHGIYYTSKLAGNATKWSKANSTMPDVLTFDIRQQTLPNYQCNNSGAIYVGTHGRGAWVSNTFLDVTTAVPTVAKAAVPDNLKVYPNPMTTQGNIEFNLSSTDDITIIVYNIQGKEVKNINMKSLAPGNHIVPFATNDLNAGTYFVALTGSNFRKVSKFVVVK